MLNQGSKLYVTLLAVWILTKCSQSIPQPQPVQLIGQVPQQGSKTPVTLHELAARRAAITGNNVTHLSILTLLDLSSASVDDPLDAARTGGGSNDGHALLKTAPLALAK